MRKMERRSLHAPVVDQVRILFVQPSVLKGLPIKICAGIRCGYRHLESVWIDFTGKPDRLLDRLLRLTGQAENKGAVDDDAELVAVFAELPRDINPHSLLDVVQNLLVARLITYEQQPQPVVAHSLKQLPRDISLGVAGPGDASLPSSRAIAAARGASSVKVSSSKKNSFTCGSSWRAQRISSITWPTLRVR